MQKQAEVLHSCWVIGKTVNGKNYEETESTADIFGLVKYSWAKSGR